ncbi:hypothetical protein J14TS2_14510 [Bacillus sp. J14TS2]|uniref:hypothetical protein n=1 Tax=Bacillus sp. J14TS2 TaxID=2807188 RepID=UPI001B1DD510|nr:hypothetical protein [Bacillus sp. J14TS2]GIN70976.1 hypothetical protein J14TS2_14510 [Bacillus sp. J14TS2]
MEQFIIFIIVAVVGLLFNRSKINNQKQQSEQPRPVQTRPMQMEEAREESSPFAEATEARTLKDAADQLKTQPDLYKQQEEMAAKLNDLNREEELHRKKIEVINTEVYDEEVQLDFDLKQKDIVNGIIMSEVLGPPRARKPYNRRRT